MDQRFDPDALRTFAEEILTRAGVPAEPAHAVATGLVEGDVYGHVTHGLALLGGYVEEIENGTMATDGRPDVVADAAPGCGPQHFAIGGYPREPCIACAAEVELSARNHQVVA